MLRCAALSDGHVASHMYQAASFGLISPDISCQAHFFTPEIVCSLTLSAKPGRLSLHLWFGGHPANDTSSLNLVGGAPVNFTVDRPGPSVLRSCTASGSVGPPGPPTQEHALELPPGYTN